MSKNSYRTVFKGRKRAHDVLWQISGDILLRNGEPVADLSTVTSGQYQYMKSRSGLDRSLTIESSLGSAVITRHTGYRPTPDVFLKLSTMVLRRISDRSPDARVHIGGGRSEMIAHFVVAIGWIVAGVVLLATASGDDIAQRLFAVPFILVGLWKGILSRPWDHERLLVAPDDAIAVLRNGPYSFSEHFKAEPSSR